MVGGARAAGLRTAGLRRGVYCSGAHPVTAVCGWTPRTAHRRRGM